MYQRLIFKNGLHKFGLLIIMLPEGVTGNVKQWVASGTADPVVRSLILALSHTFVEIDHEIISLVILLLLIRVVSYKPRYMHEVLVNHLKSCLHMRESVVRLSVSHIHVYTYIRNFKTKFVNDLGHWLFCINCHNSCEQFRAVYYKKNFS